MKTHINILIAALFAAFVSTTHAGPPSPLWPGWESRLAYRVTTEKAAEDCCKEEGVKVALVCKDCKSVTEKPGTEKKGILGWFKADSMHDCSGCSGKITVKAGTSKVARPRLTSTCAASAAQTPHSSAPHTRSKPPGENRRS